MKKLLLLLAVVTTMVTLTSVTFADVGKVKSQPSIAQQAQSQSPECSVVMTAINTLLPALEVNAVPAINSSTVALSENGCAEVNCSSNLIINTASTNTGNDNQIVMLPANKNMLQMANNSSGNYNFSTIGNIQQSLAMVNLFVEESVIKKISVNTTTKNPVVAKDAIPEEIALTSTTSDTFVETTV